MTSWYKQQLKDWVAGLEVRANRVLDIGGSQDPIQGRTKTWYVDKYLIADLPTPHQGKQPDVLVDLNRDNPKDHRGYIEKPDLIFCLEVFDYIWNPVNAFQIIRNIIAPGGSVWLSCGLLYPVHNPVEDDSLRLTETGIRKLAESVGFTVEEVIYRRARSRKLLEYYAEDNFRAAPGQDHSVIGYIVRLSC